MSSSVWYLGIVYSLLFFPADCLFAIVLRSFRRDHISDAPFEDTPLTGGVSLSSLSRNGLNSLMQKACYAVPVLVLLQVVGSDFFSWCFFSVPDFIGVTVLLGGCGAALFYVIRVLRLLRAVEVTRSQWVALSWFRLDATCIAATVLLVGWGNWLAAALLYLLDVYYASELLLAEKAIYAQGEGDV